MMCLAEKARWLESKIAMVISVVVLQKTLAAIFWPVRKNTGLARMVPSKTGRGVEDLDWIERRYPVMT